MLLGIYYFFIVISIILYEVLRILLKPYQEYVNQLLPKYFIIMLITGPLFLFFVLPLIYRFFKYNSYLNYINVIGGGGVSKYELIPNVLEGKSNTYEDMYKVTKANRGEFK